MLSHNNFQALPTTVSTAGQPAQKSYRRIIIVCVLAVAVVASTVAIVSVSQTVESHITQKTFLVGTPTPAFAAERNLVEANGQHRPKMLIGTKAAGFESVAERSALSRHKQMQYLEQVREKQCGRFQQNNSAWTTTPVSSNYSHQTGASAYNTGTTTTYHKINRSLCTAEHPDPALAKDGVQVSIERLGPFRSTGNMDWTSFTGKAFPNLTSQLEGKDMFVKGVLTAPVFANGTFIGYPPLHMHHLHLHPHASEQETLQRILPRLNSSSTVGTVGGGYAYMDHHILAQMHGDSVCRTQEGKDDFSCLLHQLPDGQAMRVRNSTG